MAPNAKIILVEAASASYSAMLAAVDKAKAIPGVYQVSMSWGGSEFSGETTYNTHFGGSAVTFYAASGDAGGVAEFPSVSQLVVGVGGTSLVLSGTGGYG